MRLESQEDDAKSERGNEYRNKLEASTDERQQLSPTARVDAALGAHETSERRQADGDRHRTAKHAARLRGVITDRFDFIAGCAEARYLVARRRTTMRMGKYPAWRVQDMPRICSKGSRDVVVEVPE